MWYALCVVLVILFSLVAQRNRSKGMVVIIASILSLYCGLRGISVGVDTENYYKFLSYIRTLGIEFGSDIGFSTIAYFLMGIFDNPHYVLLICAIVTNFLIVFRLWDFKDKASFTLMLLIYIAFHFPYSFNIVRQYLAIAVVFWGTRYIERNQHKKYIILNCLAATLHTSALLCFSFLLINFGFREAKNRKKIMLFFAAGFFVLFGVVIFGANIDKYGYYFAQVTASFHAMTCLKVLCMFFVVYFGKVYKNKAFSVARNRSLVPMSKETVVMYQISLALAALGMFFAFMNRIGFYFIMYEMPFWGQAVRATKNRNLYRVLIGSIVLYTILMTLFTDTSGLIDYSTFLKE